MPISGILEEEQLYFFRDLMQCDQLKPPSSDIATHLCRRKKGAPLVYELRECAVRTAFLDFPQSSEDGQLVIGHTHICLERESINQTGGCRLDAPHRTGHTFL